MYRCKCDEDDYYLEPDWESVTIPPALGILSKGQVRVSCPDVIYNDCWQRLGIVLQTLTLHEGEELVEFLRAQPALCEAAECRELTDEQIVEDMAFEAYRRRAYKVARRYRDQLDDPSTFDEWCILPEPKKKART